MHAATIVPQPYLGLIGKQDYHMALAHLIGKSGFEYYTEFYGKIGNDSNKFLIMDNGLIEGDPRPIEELLQKAMMLNADELVLPDVFQDKDATLKAARAAIDHMLKNNQLGQIRLMAVPQGKTFEEWLYCAEEMLQWPIDTLGIPKVLTKMMGRDARLTALVQLQHELGDTAVHLLGCGDSPLELKTIENVIRQGHIKPVRGVDSAIPYVYARAGLRMSEAERPSGAIDFDAVDADISLLGYNIEMWQSECATLPPIGATGKIQRLW